MIERTLEPYNQAHGEHNLQKSEMGKSDDSNKLFETNIQTSEVKTKHQNGRQSENSELGYIPEGYELTKSKNLRSADVKRANITSSDGARDLVGDGQTRRNTVAQGYPNHVSDPKRHVPCHCHGLSGVLFEVEAWTGSFRAYPLKELD